MQDSPNVAEVPSVSLFRSIYITVIINTVTFNTVIIRGKVLDRTIIDLSFFDVFVFDLSKIIKITIFDARKITIFIFYKINIMGYPVNIPAQ